MTTAQQVGAMRVLEERMDAVARTHAGWPQAEVLAALERVIGEMGLQPDYPDVARRAQEISEARPEH